MQEVLKMVSKSSDILCLRTDVCRKGHRVTQAGGDLRRSQCNLLLKALGSDQASQGLDQLGLGNLQGWRPHNLPGQHEQVWRVVPSRWSDEGPSLLSKAPAGHLLLKWIPLLLILAQTRDMTRFGPKSVVVALLASWVEAIDSQETKIVY